MVSAVKTKYFTLFAEIQATEYTGCSKITAIINLHRGDKNGKEFGNLISS